MNFTVTNLLYTSALGNSNSKNFIAAKKTLAYLVSDGRVPLVAMSLLVLLFIHRDLPAGLFSWQLDRVLKNSSISPAYTGCTVVGLR